MRTIAATLSAIALASAGAMLPATSALAQQIALPAPVLETGHSLLTITGTATSDVAPDVAMFSAGVTTQAANASEALAENSRKMDAVITALKRAGIADRDIQTSNLSINPVYSDPNRDAMMSARMTGQPYVPPPPEQQLQKIIGYSVTNNVSVRQRDLKNFGRVIDTLVSAGANQVNGPSFSLDNPEPLLDKARAQAVRNARQRAQLYADAAGLKIVRILSISEGGGYFQPRMEMRSYAMAGAPPPPPPPAPVQPGQLELTANVSVLYELAP